MSADSRSVEIQARLMFGVITGGNIAGDMNVLLTLFLGHLSPLPPVQKALRLLLDRSRLSEADDT